MTPETPPTDPDGLPDPVAPLGDRLAGTFRTLAVVVGVSGVALAVGAATEPRQFFHSYLFGYVFALDVALGALFWVLIHHVADAGWSVGLRRVFENVTRAVLPLAALIVPVLVGIYTGNLHQWYDFIHKDPATLHGHEAHIQHVKHVYFSAPFFIGRLALYFAVWVIYSRMMRTWSAGQDAVGGAALTRKMQWWAPSGVALLGLTATFFAFDLVMSLQYTWFSTIFGVYFWAGGIRGSLAAGVLIVLALRAAGHLRHTITVEHLHDAAKLMFGFTVFWAYIAFSQYFLIWYGNMPEETQFYLLRRNGAWYPVSMLLPVLYFVVPFFMLLPRAHKRSPAWLALISVWILVMHAYDLYWQVMPVLHPDTVHLSYLDAAAPVCLFGVVLLATVRGLQRLPLIPVRDARLGESIGYVNETP
ncbi:MAG: quinol:cytochrome C oxidoreductase [Isosphaera sp.]|nr:quinol:cytochrome C oxidoreductase [Isosphaera sp.]